MFCKNCGYELPDGAKFCTKCGAAQYENTPTLEIRQEPRYQEPRYMEYPSNHLVLSILVTVFCCIPFGIIGIVNASKVDSCVALGKYEEARIYSKRALNWSIWGMASYAVIIILYLVFLFVALAAGSTSVFEYFSV